MEGQMSIFDFMEPKTDELESLTTADMARFIGDSLQVDFKPTGWEDEHEARVKKLKLSVHKEYYLCDTRNRKKGDAFIGVGYSFNTEGGGSPADSIDEAIRWFRKRIERYA